MRQKYYIVYEQYLWKLVSAILVERQSAELQDLPNLPQWVPHHHCLPSAAQPGTSLHLKATRNDRRMIQFWSGIAWWRNQPMINKLFLPWTNVNFSMSSSFPSAILKFISICAHSANYTATLSLTDCGFIGLDGMDGSSEDESKAFCWIFENVNASSSRTCGFSRSCWDWRNSWSSLWKVKSFAMRFFIICGNIDHLFFQPFLAWYKLSLYHTWKLFRYWSKFQLQLTLHTVVNWNATLVFFKIMFFSETVFFLYNNIILQA